MLLFQTVQGTQPLRWLGCEPQEANLRRKLHGTVWWPGVIQDQPGVFTADYVVGEMGMLLEIDGVQPPMLDAVAARLRKIPVWELLL